MLAPMEPIATAIGQWQLNLDIGDQIENLINFGNDQIQTHALVNLTSHVH